jgi:hypothetical protein
MNDTTQQLGLLEQAALMGRAVAIDMFVETLNPANRPKLFEWDILVDRLVKVVTVSANEMIPKGQWAGARLAITNLAITEAQMQMQDMIDMSRVKEWVR